MALFDVTERDAAEGQTTKAPPLWQPHGLRSLEFELSDAGVSISEARQVQPHSAYGFGALEALGVLAFALEKGDLQRAESALAKVDRVWQTIGERPTGGGIDAAVWRAVWRVSAACRGWLYKAASEGSKAKSRSLRMEAGRLRRACGF